jgi:aminoglycoside phosphotransferase (APT) family kinase protein
VSASADSMSVDTLPAAIEAILGAGAQIVERQPKLRGMWGGEYVICRHSDGSVVRLYCKHAVGEDLLDGAFGHRGGLLREQAAYEHVLPHARLSIPRYLGTHVHEGTGERWLTLEFLSDAVRLHEASDPRRAIDLCAAWLGQFHAVQEERIGELMPIIPRYDASYYAGWARRAEAHAGALHNTYSWLRRVCRRFAEEAERLLTSAPTVIHGEFYPKNILLTDGEVRPVDWESAAIASGEIDLATLTEGWGDRVTESTEHTYVRARWPAGRPPKHESTLAAARVYVFLRWFADHRATFDQRRQWPFDRLHALAETLSLL